MGCLVGIDFGTKRTGIACTDPKQIIASGLKNLPTDQVIPFLKSFCQLEVVDLFVVGKPMQKDGNPSPLESKIYNFIKKLKQNFPEKEIKRYDERYTSKIAFQTLIDSGLKKKQRADKGIIDQVSATLILQSYLEYKLNTQ